MAYADTLIKIRNYYATALEEDADDPQPNYSLDGESWDRDSWRRELMQRIKDLNELITSGQPYVIRSLAI